MLANAIGEDCPEKNGLCYYAGFLNMPTSVTGVNCTSKQLLKWNLRVVIVAENAKVVEIKRIAEEDIMKSRFTVGAFYCWPSLNSLRNVIGRDCV